VSPRSQPIGNIVGADAGRQARERAEREKADFFSDD